MSGQTSGDSRIGASTLALFALVLLLALLAACSDPPTSSPNPAPGVSRDVATAPFTGVVRAVDLGVLPGDVASEATFVAEGGAVYGRSVGSGGASRFFRWTQGGGMAQVASVPNAPTYPLPTVSGPLPPLYGDVLLTRANAKGEATGAMCPPDCEFPSPGSPGDEAHALRYSRGAGLVELDTRRSGSPFGSEVLLTSYGLSINRWGHVAGAYWAEHGNDGQAFFWSPADSFQLVSLPAIDVGSVQVNDIDQVIGSSSTPLEDLCSFVWRTDLGRRDLVTSAGECIAPGNVAAARALAQQVSGSLVVGWGFVQVGGRSVRRAAPWRVPAPSRAAYPRVDANPIGATATVSLARTGGRYHQFIKATQSTSAGPYVELVDWGDGASSRRTRAAIAGKTYFQVHTYGRTGAYWVRVYVKDARGRWGVDERRVTITN